MSTSQVQTLRRFIFPPWLSGHWGMVGIACILYELLFIAWTYFHWGGEENITLIGDLAILPPMLLASLTAWRVAAQSTFTARIRRAWLLLGLSMFMNFIGNAAWTYLENVLQVQPFPSIADVFYLVSYPLMLWGLLTLSATPESRREHLIFWFDLIITLTTASMFVGYFLIIPTVTLNDSDLLSQILATAYPVWSLILLGGVLALILRRLAEADTRAVLLLLLAGIGFFLISDLTFGYASLAGTYVVGGWIDVGWQVAQVFMVFAALRQMHREGPGTANQWWPTVLDRVVQRIPLLAIVLGYGLVLYVVIVDFDQVAVWLLAGALLLTALVIGQQIVSPAFTNLPIRAKVILTFILVSVLSVSLVSLMSYFTIHSNLQSAVGVNLKARAADRAGAVSSLLSKQSDALEGFVLSEVVQARAASANAAYGGDNIAAIWDKLNQRELAWKAASDSDPFVQEVLNNEAADELRKFRENFPGYGDLLLTDKYGAVVAATARPTNYDQSILSWWQGAFHKGEGAIYMSQPILDPGTGSHLLMIVMPVRARHLHSEMVGLLMATYSLDDLGETLASNPEHPGENSLLLPTGQILSDTDQVVFLDQDTLEHLRATADADFTWAQYERKTQLVSQAGITGPQADPEESISFASLNWLLITHQDPDQAFAPLNAAWRTILLSIFAALFLATGLGVILAQMLVSPISRLTAVTKQIGEGDLSTKVEVESRDEIGTLAARFNRMLDALSLARQELQEREMIYRSLVDSSPDMIAVQRNEKYLFINPAGVELLGAKSADELIGRHVLDIVPVEDREHISQRMEDLKEIKESTPLIQQKMHQIDGTSFDAEFRATPITYTGEPAIQFVMRDITERKNAQEKIHQLLAQVARQRDELEIRVAERTGELNKLNQRLQIELVERQRLVQSLRYQERQLAQAVTLAKIAYWELDLNKAEFTFNDQFYNVLRTSAQKVGGYFIPVERFVREFIHPDDANRILERIQDAQNPSKSSGQLEYCCTCGDGQIQNVFLEYQIVFDGDGRPIRVFGAHMDVTERQQLVQSLRESEEQFRLLFEASPDAILLIDPNVPGLSWPIIDCNEAACTMNGHTREELIGQSIDILNAAPPQSAEREEYIKRIRQKGILHYETIHCNKDGRRFPVEVSTSIITFAGRELVLGIDRDITERKQAELALQEAKNAAEESRRVAEAASRAKSDFLSRMSHELRTPMNAILGFAQLLEMSHKEPLTSNQQERVKQIVKGGQHLLDLINEILDISRIEANRLQISPEPVSIQDSVREVVDLTVPLAVKRHIQIVTKLGRVDENPFVLADRQRFKQVLLNLLGNAVKYNLDGGSVILTCQQMPSSSWRISITDTGPGIPQDQMGRLFQPFERLVTDESGVEGTGLGLTLAKRLVELMHGQIGVDSTLGKGSTFWIELPATESPLDRLRGSGGTSQLPMMSSASQTILYIEDNVANFELIKQVFADYSQIELLWAADPKSGIETALQHRPNLILLDLHFGDKDGDEVLQQLKEGEATAGIPVVIVSADATSGQARRLISLGAHAYLTKPLNVRNFINIIEEILGEKAP